MLPGALDGKGTFSHVWLEILARKGLPNGPDELVYPKCQESVQRGRRSRAPQTVTKPGKPAVVVIGVAEYERLRLLARAQAPSFADLLVAMPQDDGEFPRLMAGMRDLDP